MINGDWLNKHRQVDLISRIIHRNSTAPFSLDIATAEGHIAFALVHYLGPHLVWANVPLSCFIQG